MDAETATASDAWHTYLNGQGAHFETPDRVTFATDKEAVNHGITVLMPLVHMAIVEVEGPDSEKFLQGQTSAAVNLADGQLAPPTSFCTPKGRMIANAQLLQAAPQRYWLLLDASVAEALRAHLAKYAAFYKAELRLRTDLAIIGIAGTEASSALQKQGIETPDNDWTMHASDSLVVTHHPGDTPRFVMIGETSLLSETWRELASTAIARGNETWSLLDIRAGLLWINEAQRETLLPQMINWEALGGISFKKGCYTGQEVVARAHYRGQVKKRLMRFHIAGDQLPSAGASLVNDEGKPLGDIMMAASLPEGGLELLAVVTQKEEMPALQFDNVYAEPLPLPYPLERLDPETFVRA